LTWNNTPMNEFDKNFFKEFKPLKLKFEKIENDLFNVLSKSLTVNKTTNAYWESLRKEINLLYLEMKNVYTKWAEINIPARFKRSIQKMMSAINQSKIITNRAQFAFTEMMKTTPVKNISNLLYQDSILSMLSALESGKSKIMQLTRLTQQRIIDESLISQTIADAVEFGNIDQAIKRLSNSLEVNLWRQVNEKQFVIAGTRKFRPDYYAELLARTRFHEAQSQATILTCHNYDTDLVQISSHNTTTAICLPFEGKIFSLSGKDKRFPPFTEEPPFHPNCLHLMYPYFLGALEETGTLKEYSDFSLGKTSKPPGRNSFIPIDERTVA
jgi:hypothetical protein